jgi:hypothetical protein
MIDGGWLYINLTYARGEKTMPIKCARGKPRYRAKKISKTKYVRVAYCGKKLKEAKVKTYKKKRHYRKVYSFSSQADIDRWAKNRKKRLGR